MDEAVLQGFICLVKLPELKEVLPRDSRSHKHATALKQPSGLWPEIRYHCCVSLKAI
jgi:hypothetical protein